MAIIGGYSFTTIAMISVQNAAVMSTEVETSLNILLHSKVRDPSISLGMTKENAYARVQEYKYSS